MNPVDDVDHDIMIFVFCKLQMVTIVNSGLSFLEESGHEMMTNTALNQHNRQSSILKRSRQLVRMETD